jgi:AcrR family transcriptional regulator
MTSTGTCTIAAMPTHQRVRQQPLERRRLGVDARRGQLVSIGVELFSHAPYDDVWVEDVAARAGVSRSLLYHYFPTKRDFYVEVVRAAAGQVGELTEPDAALPPLERLRASMSAYLEYVEENSTAYRTVHGAGIGSDPEVRAIVEESHARHVDRLLSELVHGRRPPELLRLAVRGWLGFVVTTTLQWLDRRRPRREALRDLFVDVFLATVDSARRADPAVARALEAG